MRKRIGLLLLLGLSLLTMSTSFAQITITGGDAPNDKGKAIELTWTLDRNVLPEGSQNISIMRSADQSNFVEVKSVDISATKHIDQKDLENYTPYFYKFVVKNVDGMELHSSSVVGPFESKPQWFNTKKTATFIFAVIAISLILTFIRLARQGRELYIRPLPGVKAIEDAVGRATEMGKPCVYSPGIGMIEDIATLASISILSKVGQTVAEYQSRLVVPNYDPIVYSVTDEVVRNSYMQAGRPDAYQAEDVYFLTQRQFAYASGMAGLMAREKPGANFFLGYFMAESLILAEAGAMTGAIQIAGTDSISQIPFFIVACDYTLIGEELYAAGAVMGNDPKLIGGLKGQDYVKLVVMVILILFFLLKLFGVSGMDKILVGG